MTNYEFNFNLSTEIKMAEDISSSVGKEVKNLGKSNVLVVCGPTILKKGLLEPILNSLYNEDLNVTIFDKIVPNPRIIDCEAGAEIARKNHVDIIVAVGGGSSLDTGKAIGALITNKGPLINLCGEGMVKNPSIPLIAIPTTAGTGSEVTPFVVVTDTKNKTKLNIFDSNVTPALALLDPKLLLSLPSSIMASTGIDALTHAIEAYTCKLATPITDAHALQAIKLINKNLIAAVNNPTIENCKKMLIGSTIAGIAFGYSDVGSVHCLAESLGGFYDLPHGIANSIFLPLVFSENIESNPPKHSQIAFALGVAKNDFPDEIHSIYGAKYIQDLIKTLKIPKFRSFKIVDPEDFHLIAKAATENVSASSNPKLLTENDYFDLLEKAYR